MTHDEMIAVIQAHKEGKKLQVLYSLTASWEDISNPSFNFSVCKYRVKPEPKTIYVNEYTSGMCAHPTKEAALGVARSRCIRRSVKYVEVLEE